MILRYDTIANELDSVQLIKQTFPESNEFTLYIIIKENWDSKTDIYWDNEIYIYGKFYKFLKRYLNKSLKRKDSINFKDIWHLLNEQWVEDVLEILDESIKLNWNETISDPS